MWVHVPVVQLYQMQMLTYGCQPGDSLIFHFSGAPPAACQIGLSMPCKCDLAETPQASGDCARIGRNPALVSCKRAGHVGCSLSSQQLGEPVSYSGHGAEALSATAITH